MIKIFKNLNLKDLDGEVWKDIKDYEGNYQVSNFGRVKSLKFRKERILKQNKVNKYFQVGLCKNRKYKNKLVNRLVYETFKEKLEEDYDVHHINEDEENNFVENLESKPHSKHIKEHRKGKKHSEETRNKMSENHADFRGEKSGKHKLKDGEVWLIKKILNSDYYKSGKINQTFIGKMFGVSYQTISMIKNNKIWNHII
jgi:hypothetical protein